jgi:pyruvate dehydrogenase E1 component alpha subunit
MGTPVQRAVALYENVAEAARSYGIKAERVDGMDVLAVRDMMRGAVDQARTGRGPFFIEAMTYRFMGHSMADPSHGHYRTKEEVEEHRKRDPLLLLKHRMLSQQLCGESDFKQVEQAVTDVVAAAVKFADESPFPDLATLHDHVMAEE